MPVAATALDQIKHVTLSPEQERLAAEEGNAIGRLAGHGVGAHLLLYAPIDTLTVGDPAEDVPWAGPRLRADMRALAVEEGDFVTGLGASNPKGHGACLITAGSGCSFLLEQGLWPDYALIAKPGWAVAWEEVGLCWFRITVHGTFSYVGSRHRLPYSNPIVTSGIFIRALEEWFAEYTARHTDGLVAPQGNIGSIEGGWPRMASVSPAACEITIDLRLGPRTTPAQARAEFAAFITRFLAANPAVSLDWDMILSIEGTGTTQESWIVRAAIEAWGQHVLPAGKGGLACRMQCSDPGVHVTMTDKIRPLRIGLRVPPCQPVDVLTSTVVEAEQAGFDDVWFPDSQLLWRDVFCVLTAAVLRTESIMLGTAVTNVITRHPSVLASAARTIAEIRPGRFRLGLGVGNSSLLPIGLAASTQQEMRSAVDMVRTLLRGEEYAFGGRRSRLRDPGGGVPIYLAATGPRNLRLAGELADGVILLSGVAPAGLARATKLVGDGVAASGRGTEDVDLVVSAYCQVTDDIERDARMLKPVCAAMAQNGGGQFLRAAGIDIDVPTDVPQVYPDLAHAEDWKQAIDITSRWVSDADAVRFADAFCLFGTGEQIAARLLATQRAGATSVFLQHVGSYDVPAELLRAVSREVLPRLPVAVR